MRIICEKDMQKVSGGSICTDMVVGYYGLLFAALPEGKAASILIGSGGAGVGSYVGSVLCPLTFDAPPPPPPPAPPPPPSPEEQQQMQSDIESALDTIPEDMFPSMFDAGVDFGGSGFGGGGSGPLDGYYTLQMAA